MMKWFAACLAAALLCAVPARGQQAYEPGTNRLYVVPVGPTAPVTPSGGIPTASGSRTLVTLDIKTVTTGGTAVTAIAAGNRAAGGFLQNPPTATINLCVNEIGTATGTASSGDTTCIIPGQGYVVAPAAGAVSVVSSDAAHPFSGYGLK